MSHLSVFPYSLFHLSGPMRLIHVLQRPAFFMKSHNHNFYHLIFVTDGILDISVNEESYTIHKNQAILLPPKISHALSSTQGYSQIGLDIWDNHDFELCRLLSQTFPSGIAVINYPIPHSKFQELDTAIRTLTIFNRLKLQNYAESLVLSFIEQGASFSNSRFRSQFLDMVAHDEMLTMSLTEMCQHLAISKTHLERLVHKEFGCSAKEYYNHLKLMKICFFLQNTELSLKEISEKLSFYDESHLSRFFKKNIGLTPLQYRNGACIPELVSYTKEAAH